MLFPVLQKCRVYPGWRRAGFANGEPERRVRIGSTTMTRQTVIEALGTSIRAALAAGLSVEIAQLVGLQYPIYALIAAVIVTDRSSARTRQLALPRLAGTVLGAMLGAAINPLLQPGPWGVGLSIVAAMFASHLLRLQDAAKVAGYVCGIVVLSHGDHPWLYGAHRIAETGLGIVLAVLVSLVPTLIPNDKPKPSAQSSQQERSAK